MTLLKPGGIREYAPQNFARQVRLLATAFLQGKDGVQTGYDFFPTGSNTSMDVAVGPGGAFLHYPGTYQGANAYFSDGTEVRTISAAPVSGNRYDVLGVQVWDKEYGDTQDNWDLVILTNPLLNTKTLPTPSPASCKWYPLQMIQVPHGAATASLCTFTALQVNTAPVRFGGYGGSDLLLPDQDVVTHHTNVVRANSYVYSFVVPAPQTYKVIELVFTSPIGGVPQIPGSYVMDFMHPTEFQFRLWDTAGVGMAEGTAIEYYAIYKK